MDGASSSSAGSVPTAYMQLGARAGSKAISEIGIFPIITDAQKAALVDEMVIYDRALDGFFGNYIKPVLSPGGTRHTKIDCDELAARMSEPDVRLKLNREAFAFELRDILAGCGVRVILNAEVQQLEPGQELFEGPSVDQLA